MKTRFRIRMMKTPATEPDDEDPVSDPDDEDPVSDPDDEDPGYGAG